MEIYIDKTILIQSKSLKILKLSLRGGGGGREWGVLGGMPTNTCGFSLVLDLAAWQP